MDPAGGRKLSGALDREVFYFREGREQTRKTHAEGFSSCVFTPFAETGLNTKQAILARLGFFPSKVKSWPARFASCHALFCLPV
jgi:hypothetical protein